MVFFFGALAVTVLLGTYIRGCASGAQNGGGYYLQATSALKAGDTLSPETAAWRSAVGKRTDRLVTDRSKQSESYWGWRVLSPIRAGQPVPKNSIAATTAEARITLPEGMVGFMLSGDELAAVSELIRPGSRVNVVAVFGAGDRPNQAADPSVTTVVEGAPVLHVRQGVKRGSRGLDPAVAVAVTPEQSENLAAWRLAGRLVVTIAGRDPPIESREGNWRPLLEAQQSPGPTEVTDAEVVAGGDPANDTKTVSVVTPSGVQKQPVD